MINAPTDAVVRVVLSFVAADRQRGGPMTVYPGVLQHV
jgi:hypothetical protein